MLRTSFTKHRSSIQTTLALVLLAGFVLLAGASTATAGGFYLSVETPGSPIEPQLKDVVLIARVSGCHQPADAKLSATAEGLVNGARKSVPLELRSIGSGVYGIKQQWPSEGTWVLALTGAYNGMTTSALVELGPNGKVLPGTRLEEGSMKGVHAKGARRAWIAADIDAALKSPSAANSEASNQPDQHSASPLGSISLMIAGVSASVFAIGFIRRSRRAHTNEKIDG
ncbi:MAG TPA: hypothetical protein VKN18_28780 [Blastocatellia bacterium]|nr:hypothetical protein [Blastocatellia bacterium]